MRLHQWPKNMLVFAPAIAGHTMTRPGVALHGLWGFLAFGLMASCIYLFNDLTDLAADRRHPINKSRPLASGEMTIPQGIVLAIACFAGSMALGAVLLGAHFVVWLLVYAGLASAYTLYLKPRLIADVLALAALYAIRITAGGAATGTTVSHWLLAFAMFFFISLAFAKRFTEVAHLRREGVRAVPGRGYLRSDLHILRIVGPASGYLAIMVLVLYICSPDVRLLYATPDVLWLLCPLLMYWVTRLWFIANRRHLDADPLIFALRDRESWAVALLSGLVLAAASFDVAKLLR